jgi:pimeloyl-ACP methyl ester carboxylesterase
MNGFRKTCRSLALLAVVAMIFVLAPDAGATDEVVTLKHKGLTLNGRLVVADGHALSDGTVLITHGTLAHNGMEIIQALQTVLSDRGHNSLAITLSLGLDSRSGMYDCKVPHTHKHTDALDEIGAWLGWLKGQGVENVALMGHSRGGNQTAWFAAERPDPLVKKVALIAPQTWDEQGQSASYEKGYGVPLAKRLNQAQEMVGTGKGREMMSDIGFIYCPGASATAEAFVSYYQPDPRMHTPNLIPQIKVPVLVVAATEDQVVKGLPDAMAPLVKSGAAQMKIVEGADHYFLDFFIEDAADAVDAFIAN